MAKKSVSSRRPTVREVFTPANVLTMLRIALIVPLVYLLWATEARWAAVLVFGLASITDFFDGYLARKRNEFTMLGQLLDPIADKALVIAVLTVYVLQKVIPISWLLVLVAKELVLLAGGAILLARGHTVVPARQLGKWSTGILLVGMLVIMAGAQGFGRGVMALGVILSLGAGIDYGWVVLRQK